MSSKPQKPPPSLDRTGRDLDRTAAAKVAASTPTPDPNGPSLPEKLAKAQADVERWTRLAASPNLSPAAAALAHQQMQSAQAAVKLRQKAMDYATASELDPPPGTMAPGAGPMPAGAPPSPSPPSPPPGSDPNVLGS